MMMATVITCPGRWNEYQRLRRQFEALGFPFALRTFQTAECLESAFANNNLNARDALAYAKRHLRDDAGSWLLYLEDDVVLHAELPRLLPFLVGKGVRESIDCWYLCNRRNPVLRQYCEGSNVLNELGFPPAGAHALLLPYRHLQRILDSHWAHESDRSIFEALRHPAVKIVQIVHPVLVEHAGEYSTFNPNLKQKLEVNYAA